MRASGAAPCYRAASLPGMSMKARAERRGRTMDANHIEVEEGARREGAPVQAVLARMKWVDVGDQRDSYAPGEPRSGWGGGKDGNLSWRIILRWVIKREGM